MADFGVGEALAAVALVGTAASAYATYSSGQAQAEASDHNARLADMQAQQARDAAKIDAENQAEIAKRAQAGVRARIAASGVEMGEGSPLLVLMDNARQASLENQRILYGGELRAQGLEANAALSRYSAGRYREAGGFGAGINLLSGIGKTGSQYFGRSRGLTALSGPSSGYGSAFEG